MIKENKLQPLVSIIVITYNSSKHVIETLKSAKSQLYRNIELIISDDFSTDNTIDLCQSWLKRNKNHFIRVKLIAPKKNTGIPANCNRGFYESNGKWIKTIAGDDILDEECISSYINHINKHNLKETILFSNQVLFSDSIETPIKSIRASKLLTVKYNDQLIDYLCDRPTIAPTSFISKKVYNELNGYDEKYKLLEDVPFFYKALKNKVKFNLIDKDLVYYRISEESISNDSTNENSNLFLNSIKLYYQDQIYPDLLKKGLIFNYLKAKLKFRFASRGQYPKYLYSKAAYRILIKIATLEKKARIILS